MTTERHIPHFQEELEQLKARLLEMGGLAEDRLRLVAGQHAIDQPAVAVDQPLDGQPNLFLRQPAHFEQPGLELIELLLEVPDSVLHHPNLPVT